MNTKEYLFVCLMEELAEMQQAISKILRFTEKDHHPSRVLSNYDELQNEWSDVNAIIAMLGDHEIYFGQMQDRIFEKKDRTRKYMEYSKNLGTLNDDSHN